MIITARLQLRQWRKTDLPKFAALNADPEVMEFMTTTLSRSESDALAARIRDEIASSGWGVWAVEILGGAPFIGFVGLSQPEFEAHFTPCTEVGWRLAREHWGHGYATEAAMAARAFAFHQLNLPEIVSFTSVANVRSRRVMARLEMEHDPDDDFDHPGLPAGHPLRRHVLYRLLQPSQQDSNHFK